MTQHNSYTPTYRRNAFAETTNNCPICGSAIIWDKFGNEVVQYSFNNGNIQLLEFSDNTINVVCSQDADHNINEFNPSNKANILRDGIDLYCQHLKRFYHV